MKLRKFASEIYRPLLPGQQLVQMPDGKLRICSQPTTVQQQPLQPVQQQPGLNSEQSPIPRLV